jgi:hypothetical protein
LGRLGDLKLCDCDALRTVEGIEQASPQPGVSVEQRLSNADRVHDRKMPGSREPCPFGRDRIGKQRRDPRIAGSKGRRWAQDDDRIQLARKQTILQALVWR